MSRYKPVYIGEKRLPVAFHTHVVMRQLGGSEKSILAFYEAYNEAKLKSKATQPPSKLQYKIAELVKSGKSKNDVAKQLNVSIQKVFSSLRRVAVWEFLKDN